MMAAFLAKRTGLPTVSTVPQRLTAWTTWAGPFPG